MLSKKQGDTTGFDLWMLMSQQQRAPIQFSFDINMNKQRASHSPFRQKRDLSIEAPQTWGEMVSKAMGLVIQNCVRVFEENKDPSIVDIKVVSYPEFKFIHTDVNSHSFMQSQKRRKFVEFVYGKNSPSSSRNIDSLGSIQFQNLSFTNSQISPRTGVSSNQSLKFSSSLLSKANPSKRTTVYGSKLTPRGKVQANSILESSGGFKGKLTSGAGGLKAPQTIKQSLKQALDEVTRKSRKKGKQSAQRKQQQSKQRTVLQNTINHFYQTMRQNGLKSCRFIAKPWQQSNQIDIYDIETQTFSPLKMKDLPTGEFPFESASVIHNDVLYISGGNYKNESKSSCECFAVDLLMGVVRERASLYERRQCHCMAYLKGLLSISGEQDSSQNLIKSVQYLAPSSKSWVLLPSLKKARYEAAACSFDQRYVYVFGGCYDETIECLDYQERKSGWKLLSMRFICPDWKGHMSIASIQIQDQILVFGDQIGQKRNFLFRPSELNSSDEMRNSEQVKSKGVACEVVITNEAPSLVGYRYPCIQKGGVVYTMSVDGIYCFGEGEWVQLNYEEV